MKNNLYVEKSHIDGIGLYANKSFKKGETIAYIEGDIVVTRKSPQILSKHANNWIGIGRYSWINTDSSIFRFINHSCNPNVAHVTARRISAIRDISEDEELTMDYSFTEAEKNWSINCRCKSKNCRKKIGPISSLPKSLVQKNKDLIPKKFLAIFKVDRKLSKI